MPVVGLENRELQDLPFAQLEDELAVLASHLYAGTCRWLELVAEVDRRDQLVACTTAAWLAWRCGLTPRAARARPRRAAAGGVASHPRGVRAR